MKRLPVSTFALCALALAACPSGAPDTPAEPPAPSVEPETTSEEPDGSGTLPDPVGSGNSAGDADGSGAHAAEPTAPEVETDPERGLAAAPCGDAPAGMACVPGGYMIRGIDEDPHECDQMGMPRSREPSAEPSARLWIDTFYIHTHEVTYGEYHACMDREECPEVRTIYRDFRDDNLPMTGLSWFDAASYCESIDGRLPTEAEWEKAARGPDGDPYPWGNEPATCELANVMNEDGERSCGVEQGGSHPERGVVFPVGSRPPGRYGLYDMAGNAEEWVFDWWSRSYAECGEDCLGDNPRGPCDGAEDCSGYDQRAVRGGSWYWPGDHTTGYHRRRHYPSNDPYHHFGFRCVVDVQ